MTSKAPRSPVETTAASNHPPTPDAANGLTGGPGRRTRSRQAMNPIARLGWTLWARSLGVVIRWLDRADARERTEQT